MIGWSWVRILLAPLWNVSNSVYPTFGVDTKSRWSLLSGVYAKGWKISHTGGKSMCNLSWTPQLLEKDNSKINTVCSPNTKQNEYQRKEKHRPLSFLVWRGPRPCEL